MDLSGDVATWQPAVPKPPAAVVHAWRSEASLYTVGVRASTSGFLPGCVMRFENELC